SLQNPQRIQIPHPRLQPRLINRLPPRLPIPHHNRRRLPPMPHHKPMPPRIHAKPLPQPQKRLDTLHNPPPDLPHHPPPAIHLLRLRTHHHDFRAIHKPHVPRLLSRRLAQLLGCEGFDFLADSVVFDGVAACGGAAGAVGFVGVDVGDEGQVGRYGDVDADAGAAVGCADVVDGGGGGGGEDEEAAAAFGYFAVLLFRGHDGCSGGDAVAMLVYMSFTPKLCCPCGCLRLCAF
ncbi:hypothetical protein EJ03DRAFT_368324, partial [Teratosphaeria nubilosa]